MAPQIRVEPNKVGDLIFPFKRSLGVPDVPRNQLTLLPADGEVSNGLGPQCLEQDSREKNGHQIPSCLTLGRGTGNTAGSRLRMSSWVLLSSTGVQIIRMRTGTQRPVLSAAISPTGGSSGTSGSRPGGISSDGDRSIPQDGGGITSHEVIPSAPSVLLPHTR